MILCDRQIRQLCLYQKMIEPFEEECLNSHSLDLRIGYTAELLQDKGFCSIDLSEHTKENPYLFLPDNKLLVSSLEIFNMPANICGMFKLKSSRAREFLNHAFAGFVDGGFYGATLTMELINQSYQNYPLYPGLRVGQMIFFKTEIPDICYRDRGRYNNDKKATQSKG